MNRLASRILPLVVALTAVSSSLAGVLIRSTGTSGGKEIATEIAIDPQAVRVDAGGHSAIFRVDQQLFWVLNHKDKSYMEMTRSQMEEMAQQIGDQMSQARKMMEEQLKNVPPEQRDMVERMMKGRMPAAPDASPPAPEYARVESNVRLGSWTCDRWEGRAAGEKVEEVWTAPPAALGVAPGEFQALEELGSFFDGLAKAVGRTFPGFQPVGRKDAGYEGIPLRQVHYAGGKVESEHRVEEIRSTTFEPSRFERPEGYRKEDPWKDMREH